jgi:hypothetical protein
VVAALALLVGGYARVLQQEGVPRGSEAGT